MKKKDHHLLPMDVRNLAKLEIIMFIVSWLFLLSLFYLLILWVWCFQQLVSKPHWLRCPFSHNIDIGIRVYMCWRWWVQVLQDSTCQNSMRSITHCRNRRWMWFWWKKVMHLWLNVKKIYLKIWLMVLLIKETN